MVTFTVSQDILERTRHAHKPRSLTVGPHASQARHSMAQLCGNDKLGSLSHVNCEHEHPGQCLSANCRANLDVEYHECITSL